MPVLTPNNLTDALAAFADHPDAIALAGGTDLMVEVNERHRMLDAPEQMVVAVNRVDELRTWSVDHARGTVTIGAGVRWAEIEREPLATAVPALAQAARTVGSPQIRATGTVGGNLATCSPAGDGLPVLAALDAQVHLGRRGGERTVPIGEFMVGVKRTILEPGELITAVTVELLDGYQGYSKVGVRNAMVIATAGVCVAVDQQQHSVRIALGSVAPTIVRAPDAEHLVAEHVDWAAGSLAADIAHRAAELARDVARPITDHRSTAAYRRHAIGVLVNRQLGRAFDIVERL